MAEHAKHDGTSIFPCVDTIARLAGKTRRAVQYNLTELCELGVLVPETKRTGGRSKSTRYRLDVDALPASDEAVDERGAIECTVWCR